MLAHSLDKRATADRPSESPTHTTLSLRSQTLNENPNRELKPTKTASRRTVNTTHHATSAALRPKTCTATREDLIFDLHRKVRSWLVVRRGSRWCHACLPMDFSEELALGASGFRLKAQGLSGGQLLAPVLRLGDAAVCLKRGGFATMKRDQA